MKSKFCLRVCKIALITSFAILGNSVVSKCKAQSILGKWKGIATMIYLTAEGSAKTGKKVQVNSWAEMGTIIMELRADHTFTIKISSVNDPTVTKSDGTWTLAGNQLALTSDPKYHAENGHDSWTKSIVITGNELIITENYPLGKMAKMLASKIETKYQKI